MKRPTSKTAITLYALAFTFIFGCNQEHDRTTISAPNKIVSIPQAKNMYDAYTKRRVPLIQHYEDSINRVHEDNKKFDVGRYVYYDYKILKQYLEFIEQEAGDAGVEISTLRFYYSNYLDEAVFPNSKDSIKHPRQNSIMLSPTYNDGKKDHLFYIGNGTEGKQAIPLNDNFENIKGYSTNTAKNTKTYASFTPNINTANPNFSSLQNEQSLTLNRGTGVPPPKN